MIENSQWSCLINKQGEVLEWENKTGAEYLTQLKQLCLYAQAFLYSDQTSSSFFYCLSNQYWLKVLLKRHQEFTLIHAEQSKLPFELSKREIELLTLVSSGLSNEEIANELNISKRTVDKHIENIFSKTKTESRTLLAVFAITEHLICLPTPGKLEQSILATFKIEQLALQIANEKRPLVMDEPATFSINRYNYRPIILGVPYVEQGIGQIDTRELLNGTQLAVENINRQGGINGREVQIATAGFCVEDKPSILNAYNALLDQEVDAISTAYACYLPEVHELIATESIPYLHIATHSGSNKLAQNLPNKRIENMFQVCASDVTYSLGILNFLQYYRYYYADFMQNKTVMIVSVKWQKVDIGIDNLSHNLHKQGWNIEYVELEQEPTAYQHLMKQIHNVSPSIIVLASYFAEDIVHFHQAFIENPTNTIIYSIYAPSAFLPHEQPCEGVLWSTNSGLSDNFLGRQFCQCYEQLFERKPTYSQASIAYDQVNILANAWKQSVSPRHFKAVSNIIRQQPHYGVNGTYYFNTDSQIGLTYPETKDLSISLPQLIYQIQQGRSAVIAPELFADSQFVLPAWFSYK
ncbi:bifunctional amino acid-binding protein/DNA-binding protein [Mannheimia varigena USDA-ARS-USMARC-1296]|uniref:Bifunctional amino acid-binding protein/DNA-binding protein n=1 Tax=Mannheimia varigena USDA-ARS-USMARC-1296 TaxID=1433287 RepID=W0QAM3_9PAST|nr:LuxR C-terminal-related transcriptional regulator [Mannheimia varigena]AHG75596.1 bifunctional amino acid-binding protein/DNA-binding protein [Mannheimia varigena USDA-ARS-USMARC-1296]